ncbi:hypothetical protein CPB84DRAFT_1790856 [Gymnopilus junonius]|uniref:Uncharacterized protein n=1 Tax=Gymnopilus junonius TaxID=109634 RepID=A0A9P5NFY2_GYMJU|nr:hypothetical protein CPB84DRAFT_1790856 [Gymnopilus junonius]
MFCKIPLLLSSSSWLASRTEHIPRYILTCHRHAGWYITNSFQTGRLSKGCVSALLLVSYRFLFSTVHGLFPWVNQLALASFHFIMLGLLGL